MTRLGSPPDWELISRASALSFPKSLQRMNLNSKDSTHPVNKLLHISLSDLPCLKHLICQGHLSSAFLKLKQA